MISIPISTSTVILTGQESSGPSLPGWLPTSLDEFRDLVLETVAQWIVSGILSVIDEIGRIGLLIGDELLGAFASLGVVARPFALVAETIIWLIEWYADTLVAIASASGPLAPVVLAVGFGTAILIGAGLVRGVIEVYRLAPII